MQKSNVDAEKGAFRYLYDATSYAYGSADTLKAKALSDILEELCVVVDELATLCLVQSNTYTITSLQLFYANIDKRLLVLYLLVEKLTRLSDSTHPGPPAPPGGGGGAGPSSSGGGPSSGSMRDPIVVRAAP